MCEGEMGMNGNILITGASRGLGYALVEEALKNGLNVFACLQKKSSEGMEVLKGCYGESLEVIEDMDVSDELSVKRAYEAVTKYADSIDILVNNAGVHFEESFNRLEDMDFDIALRTFNINSLGPLRVTKHFAPLLEKGRRPVLVNISSEAGSISRNWRDKEYDYCMSKAALNMQSVILQRYFEPKGIKVLAIHPGWMKTDMGGADADITAPTAAKGIFDIIEKHGQDMAAQMYMDYMGREMDW